MLVYLVTVLILLLSTLYYFGYVRVLKKLRRYVKQLKESGYKVYMFPYNPLGIPDLDAMMDGSKNGDTFRDFKTKFVEYDVLVGNIFQSPSLTFLSPEARR